MLGRGTRFGTIEAREETGDKYRLIGADIYSYDYETGLNAIRSFIKLCTFKSLSVEGYCFFLGQNVQIPPYVRNGHMLRSIINEDLLEELTLPFLVTHGKNDKILSVEHAKYNVDLLKNGKLSIYESIGHNPFWEAPLRYNRELIDFSDTIIYI